MSTPQTQANKVQWKVRWRRSGRSLFTLLILLTATGSLLSQPHWLFSLITRIQPGALYRVNPPTSSIPQKEQPKVIALTIDDGPSSATTAILSVLERHDVKATFFNISSYVSGHEETMRQAVAAGHEFGNHLTEDKPSIRLLPDDFEPDLKAAEETLLPYFVRNEKQNSGAEEASSVTLKWLRPGMGFYNNDMVKIAEERGYQIVLGSVFPYDTHIPSSRFASAFILSTVRPGDIIVLHDGRSLGDDAPRDGEPSEDDTDEDDNCSALKCDRGKRTVETLERILPELKAQGYTVTTLTELTRAYQP